SLLGERRVDGVPSGTPSLFWGWRDVCELTPCGLRPRSAVRVDALTIRALPLGVVLNKGTGRAPGDPPRQGQPPAAPAPPHDPPCSSAMLDRSSLGQKTVDAVPGKRYQRPSTWAHKLTMISYLRGGNRGPAMPAARGTYPLDRRLEPGVFRTRKGKAMKVKGHRPRVVRWMLAGLAAV